MFEKIAPGFRDKITPFFSLSEFEEQKGTVFGLWDDYRLAYLSPSWFVFAEQNGGAAEIELHWQLGRQYFDAIPPVLHDFYRKLFESAQVPGKSLNPVSHVYECSSPDTFRKFNMQVYALPEKCGYIVVNSCVVEVPHDGHSYIVPADSSLLTGRKSLTNEYVDEFGFLRQCCHCRRIKNLQSAGYWDWIPDLVASPSLETSHTICPICYDYYYPD